MADIRDFKTKEQLKCFMELPERAQELYMWYLLISRVHNHKSYCLDKRVFEKAESPIEKILLLALELVSHELYRGEFIFYSQEDIPCGDKEYRADIDVCKFERNLWFFGSESHIVGCNTLVECDGHEFHEKTKEQVKKNNERDMALKKEGYEVLHFSGSQIFQDPIKCAKDVLEYVSKRKDVNWEGI